MYHGLIMIYLTRNKLITIIIRLKVKEKRRINTIHCTENAGYDQQLSIQTARYSNDLLPPSDRKTEVHTGNDLGAQWTERGPAD